MQYFAGVIIPSYERDIITPVIYINVSFRCNFMRDMVIIHKERDIRK